VAAGAAAAQVKAPAPTGAPERPSVPAVNPQEHSHVAPPALSPRNANYSIDVTLDRASRTLRGNQMLTWRNISGTGVTELRFHLYYNAWKNNRSTWMREASLGGRDGVATLRPDDWGWIDVTAIRLLAANSPPLDLAGRMLYFSPDDRNQDDQTVLAVPLPRVIAPGETVNIEMAWTSKIPRPFSRTGAIGNYFFIAQWFPKIGVFTDRGWNCHQFHSGTEFFADYGVYDVRITVPRGWTVGATGLERTRRDNPDNATTTHHYYQEDVHDFAWTTSPRFVERRARFDHATLPPVEMRLLLQPEHSGQADRHFDATRAALKYYGEWFGAYPYGHITIVDPAWQSRSGGMEYPTLFTAGTRWIAPGGVTSPEGVTVHEAGHQFWYGMVGNNEFEHAWIDEGLNTFATARTIHEAFTPNYLSRRYFGGFVPYVFRDVPLSRDTDHNGLSGYRRGAKLDALATPSYLYAPGAGGSLSYNKTALWLATLERHLGWPVLKRIMATFFERWKFRHPGPQDFFDIVNEVSGQDMTWFFDQVHRSSNVFDYAVERLVSEPAAVRGMFDRDGKRQHESGRVEGAPRFVTTVVVRRHGEAVFPVDVLVRFADGEVVREQWAGRDRWKLYRYERAVPADYAQVDPDRVLLLDVNYANNSLTRTPQARAASTKWMTRWLIWMQDALLTYALLV
jgi:hypothetical protein